jgi:hypothetical protein
MRQGALVLATIVLCAACPMEETADPPEVVIGAVEIRRSPADEQQYTLSLSLLNRSADTLRGMTFHAFARATVLGGEDLLAPIALRLDTTIGSGVRVLVRAGMESPFPVVPPGALVLEQIRIGDFRFTATDAGKTVYTVDGWIFYPWEVEETR